MIRENRKGQILVLATFALFTMCGVLGLAIDLGWSYFLRKSAQVAADSAALSAAETALWQVGEEGPWDCGPGIPCQAATPCPDPLPSTPTNNLEAGCLYAKQNGFTTGAIRAGRRF